MGLQPKFFYDSPSFVCSSHVKIENFGAKMSGWLEFKYLQGPKND
jgi:hypothetical protein